MWTHRIKIRKLLKNFIGEISLEPVDFSPQNVVVIYVVEFTIFNNNRNSEKEHLNHYNNHNILTLLPHLFCDVLLDRKQGMLLLL